MTKLINVGFRSYIMASEIESIHQYSKNRSKTKETIKFLKEKKIKQNYDRIPLVDCSFGNARKSIIMCKNGTIYFSALSVETIKKRINE